MLRKKITAWVLTAAMLTGLGAAAPVTAFAQTAEDVQQNRCYINGDEVILPKNSILRKKILLW